MPGKTAAVVHEEAKYEEVDHRATHTHLCRPADHSRHRAHIGLHRSSCSRTVADTHGYVHAHFHGNRNHRTRRDADYT
jgi:hypothetical protein